MVLLDDFLALPPSRGGKLDPTLICLSDEQPTAPLQLLAPSPNDDLRADVSRLLRAITASLPPQLDRKGLYLWCKEKDWTSLVGRLPTAEQSIVEAVLQRLIAMVAPDEDFESWRAKASEKLDSIAKDERGWVQQIVAVESCLLAVAKTLRDRREGSEDEALLEALATTECEYFESKPWSFARRRLLWGFVLASAADLAPLPCSICIYDAAEAAAIDAALFTEHAGGLARLCRLASGNDCLQYAAESPQKAKEYLEGAWSRLETLPGARLLRTRVAIRLSRLNGDVSLLTRCLDDSPKAHNDGRELLVTADLRAELAIRTKDASAWLRAKTSYKQLGKEAWLSYSLAECRFLRETSCDNVRIARAFSRLRSTFPMLDMLSLLDSPTEWVLDVLAWTLDLSGWQLDQMLLRNYPLADRKLYRAQLPFYVRFHPSLDDFTS